VALKVLNSDFRRHPQSFIALQREARKAQTLAHPNVVTVFDFDRDGEIVYMTMELLAGRSLESMVREARSKGIGAEQALPIIRGVAEGLAYAHRKGIVHSDLKPGNIFVTQDGTPKILDFGIARAVPSSLADDVEDVFDAGSLGAYTEAYATDEMVEGIDPHPADDMYALGIIAYELLTGRHPYQRHSAPNARKLGIVLEPLKGVSRKEARAITACLSFERRERPQNAGEFLKLFRGISTAQKATVAVAVALAAVAGYVSYQNYLETSPSIPFHELALEQQRAFRQTMDDGRQAWTFYEREHIDDAWNAAVDQFAEAYRIHPRNREAVAALNKAAKELLATAKTDEQRRVLARELQERSAHYRSYGPVVEAAK
jgi:serine/threonine protein kinase